MKNPIVRNNLMTRVGYAPYCGNVDCSTMPRTKYYSGQFHCACCSWVSEFPSDFMKEYKTKWELV